MKPLAGEQACRRRTRPVARAVERWPLGPPWARRGLWAQRRRRGAARRRAAPCQWPVGSGRGSVTVLVVVPRRCPPPRAAATLWEGGSNVNPCTPRPHGRSPTATSTRSPPSLHPKKRIAYQPASHGRLPGPLAIRLLSAGDRFAARKIKLRAGLWLPDCRANGEAPARRNSLMGSTDAQLEPARHGQFYHGHAHTNSHSHSHHSSTHSIVGRAFAADHLASSLTDDAADDYAPAASPPGSDHFGSPPRLAPMRSRPRGESDLGRPTLKNPYVANGYPFSPVSPVAEHPTSPRYDCPLPAVIVSLAWCQAAAIS